MKTLIISIVYAWIILSAMTGCAVHREPEWQDTPLVFRPFECKPVPVVIGDRCM